MIQVIHRAFDILEYLSQDPKREFSLGEITAYTGLNSGTCANIMKTLVRRNYVVHLGVKKGYRIGIMPLIITDNDAYIRLLASACKPPMNALCSEINEIFILSVVRHNRRFLVYQTKSTHEIQATTTAEQSVYKSTTARMIISSYNNARLEKLVKDVGLPQGLEWPEVKTLKQLKDALADIREKKMAFGWDQYDVVSLAVPVEINGSTVASVGIYLPACRYSEELMKVYETKLRECAHFINEIGLKRNLFITEY